MNPLKKVLSASKNDYTYIVNPQIEALPFYIKKIGHLQDKSFKCGRSNDYSEYLFFFTMTDMIFKKYKTSYPLGPSDLVLSACNTPLEFSGKGKVKNDFIYMIICGKSAQMFYNLVRKSNCIYHTGRHTQILELLTSLLEAENNLSEKENPLLAQMEASALIHQIFLSLYRLSLDITDARDLTPASDSAVNTALKYIHAHFKEEMSIDTICAQVGFSKYYFCKLFKEHMGVTIHQYVTEYRVNKSKELLSYSKLSITAIANSVGYKNLLTYSRSFEKMTNMTPSRYRELY